MTVLAVRAVITQAGPNKTVNPSLASGGTPYNYKTIALAIASQQPGDWIQLQAGTAGTTFANPYVYTLGTNSPIINFKGATNGTAAAFIRWTKKPGDCIRLKNPNLKVNTTGYTGTTGGSWPVGMGLIHLEQGGPCYIEMDWSDSTGGTFEIGDGTEYAPTIGASGNWGVGCYSHYQTFTVVSSSYWTMRGAIVRGSNQYVASYIGSDCTNYWLDGLTIGPHGVNYGGGANSNPPGIAYGNAFDDHGAFGLITNCVSACFGHGQGIANWGHHRIYQNFDSSGDCTSIQSITGKPATYAHTGYAGSLDQQLPTITTSPYPATTQCGPVLYENCRFAKAGPGDLPNGTPLMEQFSYNPIIRQSIFVDQLSLGHNMLAATVSMSGDSHLVKVCASMRVYNNSGYGIAGILDEQDSGVSGSAHASLYSDHRIVDNVLGNMVDSDAPPGPRGYLVRSLQTGTEAGSSGSANKGCYVQNNILNAPASTTTDGGGNVMSRSMEFGANGAGTVICDITDAGNGSTPGASTSFPGFMSTNVFNASLAFVNVGNREAALATALAGMVLDPLNAGNTVGVGDAIPRATVVTGGSGLTQIQLTDALWICDNFGAGQGAPGAPVIAADIIAIQPAGGGAFTYYQIAAYAGSASDTARVAGIALLAPGVTATVGVGDKVFFVPRGAIVPALNRGRN